MADPQKLSDKDLNNYFQSYLTMPEEQKQELPDNDPLVGQFRALEQQMIEQGIDPADPEARSRNFSEGMATAIRLGGGLGGAGVAAAVPGVGVPAGLGFSAGAETLANVMDQSAGIPTEAVPFSGMVGEPISTGNPILDALSSEGILGGLGLIGEGAGVIREGFESGRRFFQELTSPGTGPITAKLMSKTINPQVMESISELERLGGRKLTVTPKQNVVRSTTTRFLASIAGGEVSDADLVAKSSKELTDLFYDVYNVGENLDEAQSVIEGFAQGKIKGQEMAASIKAGQELTDSERMGVISVLRGRRNADAMKTELNKTREAFIRERPVVRPSPDTLKTVESGRNILNKLNISDIPDLQQLSGQLTKLHKKLTKTKDVKPPKLYDSRGNIVTLNKHQPRAIMDAKEDPESARAVLSVIDNITRTIGKEYPDIPRDQMLQVEEVLVPLKDSLEGDIFRELSEGQAQTYAAYKAVADQYNSVPDTLVRNMANGEFTGIIQESIQSRAAAQAFKSSVGETEAATAVTTHLMDRAKRDDGSIDFIKMRESYVDSNTYREGIREIMGSDRLQKLRHFINSAEGLTVDKPSGNFLNRLMTYGTFGGATGAMFISPQVGAATLGTVGLIAGAEAFIKRVVYSDKLGRQAIDAMKEAPTSPKARRAFASVMGALNGTQATAVHFSNEGEIINESPVRIRIDGRGQLQLDVVQ